MYIGPVGNYYSNFRTISLRMRTDLDITKLVVLVSAIFIISEDLYIENLRGMQFCLPKFDRNIVHSNVRLLSILNCVHTFHRFFFYSSAKLLLT